MKYIRHCICLALAIALALLAPAHTTVAEANNDILRLHIMANSDSAEDQRVKLIVRDAVLRYAQSNADANCMREAVEAILRDGEGLFEAVEAALRGENAEYGAQLKLGCYAFPDRQYGSELYPAGDYVALRIVLGDGAGENWWCVIFPPLCIVDAQGGETLPQGEIRFESLFLKLLRSIFGGGTR
ncbi:MAG: stage II sporulation protein R [Clostridia bacterium]|nr:stage II sporulation protein R [Clostridia bacterium]